ncbi:MAG: hypothetical protein GX896_04410 [Clostridiales bacterium]|nr:hypothetical protein [Clostridiales bacterium]
MEYRTESEFQSGGYTIKVLRPVRSQEEEQQVRTSKVINIKAIINELEKESKESKCDTISTNSSSKLDKQ